MVTDGISVEIVYEPAPGWTQQSDAVQHHLQRLRGWSRRQGGDAMYRLHCMG
jgi:hypothetical protein